MRTTRDLVIVKLEEKDNGIIIPDSLKDQLQSTLTFGQAYAIGPDCKYVKEGDYIHYNSFVGHELKDETLPKGLFTIVSENDILAIR